jgi:hypothetical protein
MLWTHKLKDISYDDHFVPNGAPSTDTYRGERISNRSASFTETLKLLHLVLGYNGQKHMPLRRPTVGLYSADYLVEGQLGLLADGF